MAQQADLGTPGVRLDRSGRIGVLRIHNPPVSALSFAVIDGLNAVFAAFEADLGLDALLVHCTGRTFVAGADITMLDDPRFETTGLNATLARVEASERIVAAVLHGTALGGGLELALACHYRVGVSGVRVGLPEVKLGILPGSLGTQRLPRLVGPVMALEMMQSGRMVSDDEALACGILDALAPGEPLDVGLRFVQNLLAHRAPPERLSARTLDPSSIPAVFFATALHEAETRHAAYPSMRAIVRTVEAAATRPYAEGEALEKRLLGELTATPQSQALRHLFFAERAATKIPDLPKDVGQRPVRRVGIVGAGTMGSGIAMAFANAGLSTVVVDTSEETLTRGLQQVQQQYDTFVKRGRLSAAQAETAQALMQGATDDRALADCDVVIEAVYEDMALKKSVCARLGEVCRPGATIATNTSTLDVDALARASGRPGDVVGLHFFSPAHTMRLLEVVRGAATEPDVLATAMRLAATLRKVAVVSGVCHGFISNRMAECYLREADALLLEGASPPRIDTLVQSPLHWGMAIGPFSMLDMAGVDVAARTLIEREKDGLLSPDPTYRIVARALHAQGRYGRKSGVGHYRHEGRQAYADPEVEQLCAHLALTHGIVRRADIADEEIVERLLYPMVNEAAHILDEGIALRPSDIDVVWVRGFGFPDYRGGPVFWADRIGLPRVVAGLERYARERGNLYGHWTVAPLLAELARTGGMLSGSRARTA